jgi:hypothetical protein
MAGETSSLVAAARKGGHYTPFGGVGETMTVAYATGELELNDVHEAGYLPPGVTVVGFIYKPDDLDSSTGLVQKITVGSTDVATALSGGQTGAGSFVAITPYTTTAPTLVKLTCTTAATGAQAGNVYLTPVYKAY